MPRMSIKDQVKAVKTPILGLILLSISLLGMIILFSWSLSMIASGRIPLSEVPHLMIKTTVMLLILTIPLMLGLILIAIPERKLLH